MKEAKTEVVQTPDAVSVLQDKLTALRAQEGQLNEAIKTLPAVQDEIAKVETAIGILTGEVVEMPTKAKRGRKPGRKAKAKKGKRGRPRGSKNKTKRGRKTGRKGKAGRPKQAKKGKRLGRPKGSKNRPKEVAVTVAPATVKVEAPVVPVAHKNATKATPAAV